MDDLTDERRQLRGQLGTIEERIGNFAMQLPAEGVERRYCWAAQQSLAQAFQWLGFISDEQKGAEDGQPHRVARVRGAAD